MIIESKILIYDLAIQLVKLFAQFIEIVNVCKIFQHHIFPFLQTDFNENGSPVAWFSCN